MKAAVIDTARRRAARNRPSRSTARHRQPGAGQGRGGRPERGRPARRLRTSSRRGAAAAVRSRHRGGRDGRGRARPGPASARRGPGGAGPGVNGGMAEFLLTDRATCIPVPDGLDSAAAAAVGVVGTSADMSLRRAGMRAGESVLVLGASGPFGTAFVQLARLGGAERVIAAGRNPERLAQDPRRRRHGGTRRRAASRGSWLPSAGRWTWSWTRSGVRGQSRPWPA